MKTYLEPLSKISLKKRFSGGETILYQGEAPRNACIVMSGVVRVYTISAHGEEQIVTFYLAGEFFPSEWIFNKAPSALFYYEALTDCEIAFTSRESFTDFCTSDLTRYQTLANYFITNYTASLLRINGLEQAKAKNKLVSTLYYLCRRYGGNQGNEVTLPIMLTHQTLASLVGLTRETTASELNVLRKMGLITYKKQRYTIYQDKLLKYIGEESFGSLTISS